MQLVLYTNGKQVVSNEADTATAADSVKNELGEGYKSVPLGTNMYMIYASGTEGLNVHAIVTELTFSQVPRYGAVTDKVKTSVVKEPAKPAVSQAPAKAQPAPSTVDRAKQVLQKTQAPQKAPAVSPRTASARPASAKPATAPAQPKTNVQAPASAKPATAPAKTPAPAPAPAKSNGRAPVRTSVRRRN